MVTDPDPLDRRAAVAELLSGRGDALVVTGLGSPTYDVHAVGDNHANYYLWGAMGGAALVGLGLALAQPDRRVIVVTGDGEQLMAAGALATIGVAAPINLDICVLDNGHYGETGMQTSHTADGVDLASMASACGFVDATVVTDPASLSDIANNLAVTKAAGPRMVVVKISADSPERSLPSRDAVFIKNRFRAHLGLAPN